MFYDLLTVSFVENLKKNCKKNDDKSEWENEKKKV